MLVFVEQFASVGHLPATIRQAPSIRLMTAATGTM
jgi:hypothetical protein